MSTSTSAGETKGVFNYLDPASLSSGEKPWSKADTQAFKSFSELPVSYAVHDIRASPELSNPDLAGFSFHSSPSSVPVDEVLSSGLAEGTQTRKDYYAEIEAAIKQQLGAKDVVIWDHTMRVRDPSSARQPVQSVHVDQTPSAALRRMKQHAPQFAADVENGRRFQLVNVWRPLGPALDHPLGLLDARSVAPEDLIAVDLLYPKVYERGKEVLPSPESLRSREGYEPRGETYRVVPKEGHKWWYVKDMKSDEVVFIKCYDSEGETEPNGRKGVATSSPHSAFEDPAVQNPPPRKSVEVRCLVFY